MADSVRYTEPGSGTAFAADTVDSDKKVQWQKELRPGAAAVTRVDADVASVTLLAVNVARLGAVLYNDADREAFVKFGMTAADDDFTHKILPGDRWELPLPAYTGRIDAIWANDVSGGMQVTELTAE